MSKPVKDLITDSYRQRFEGVEGAVLIDIRGIDANANNRFRDSLREKSIRVTVVKNSLAKRAWSDTTLQPLTDLLDGSSAAVYATDEDTSVVSVARELINWAKELKTLEFKGAVLDGIQFGPDQIKALSEYPTREEAQAQVITLLLSPARNLAGQIAGPGGKLAAIIKAIEEKLEKGEEIKAI